MNTRTKAACHRSVQQDGFSTADLHHKIGKALEHRPSVLFAGDHKFDVEDRPWEGLSLDCRPNMDCANRLQEFAAEARERMGPRKWQQLNAEWEHPNDR